MSTLYVVLSLWQAIIETKPNACHLAPEFMSLIQLIPSLPQLVLSHRP